VPIPKTRFTNIKSSSSKVSVYFMETSESELGDRSLIGFLSFVFQMDTTRSMYIVVELPKHAVRGEQLGVQVAIFNKGGEPVEVRRGRRCLF